MLKSLALIKACIASCKSFTFVGLVNLSAFIKNLSSFSIKHKKKFSFLYLVDIRVSYFDTALNSKLKPSKR